MNWIKFDKNDKTTWPKFGEYVLVCRERPVLGSQSKYAVDLMIGEGFAEDEINSKVLKWTKIEDNKA